MTTGTDRRYAPIVDRMRRRAFDPTINRRTFLFGTTALAAGVAGMEACARQRTATPDATPVFSGSPFTLGVASGEPLPDGVVLWTRLAPAPFEPLGGMGASPVEVGWVIANDEGLRDIVQQGTEIASTDWGFSVHVEVSGLQPGREYWYQFRSGQETSPVGRTKTAPAVSDTASELRFAFASCQRWDTGLFTAYRDMAAQTPDLVIHLGDYIYESRVSGSDLLREGAFSQVAFTEPRDLEGYRYRYGLYKLDPDLQEAHRIAPWLVTWDDHEVFNNYFGGGIDRDEPAAERLLERRAAAYQAYYEHQPLRRESIPSGPDLHLYRRRTFGTLLDVNVLDTRQYRDYQGLVCGDMSRAENGGFCADSLDPERTMLGAAQKDWLFGGLAATTARWNLLAQQVPMARIDNDPSAEVESYGGAQMDKWDGYAVERDEIVATLAATAAARGFAPIVITGDVHANYVWDLKQDWDSTAPESVVATEFVGTSISSEGDEPLEEDGGFTTTCGNWNGNPHNHLYDNHRGYVFCTVSAERWSADYRVLPTVKDAAATASTLTSFVVEHGRPGAQASARCPAAAPGE